jgi:SAM-dependent methyltransferase
MKLPVLPPGTILQHMYLKERLRLFKPGCFLEVGCGKGFISKVLLDLGWTGIGLDLNKDSLEYATQLNIQSIQESKYSVSSQNFLDIECTLKFDVVISCMVIEHLDNNEEKAYFNKVKKLLNPNGKMILLVPACLSYWGHEDEIAGHYRRYTFDDIKFKLSAFGFGINNLAGLTYPLSNILYPVSEMLVWLEERKLKSTTMVERTKKSGNRNVFFKTRFPNIFKLLLNELTMYPFHLLQKLNKKNDKCLVIYAESTLF